MSVLAPRPMNVPSSDSTFTETSPMASIPALTDCTENSDSRLGMSTRWVMAW